MILSKVKDVVCEIIDMNGGNLIFSPSVTFFNGFVTVSCIITDRRDDEKLLRYVSVYAPAEDPEDLIDKVMAARKEIVEARDVCQDKR